jgi:thymidylate synthase ThyX
VVNKLKHHSFSIPNTKQGEVIVLNTGAVIDAEAEAMLQALHSRSTGGIKAHLKVLAEKGAGNFMQNFYVGYGHKSIGDCGSITIFVEGVSMLVAKAIQQWPLYSGQESSTRYIDFRHQPFHNPAGTETGEKILERWREFYMSAMEPVVEHLKKQFPRDKTEDEKIYNKAISARAFDILRGFLPAGATTNLAWHTNLRQAADQVALLRHHPIAEVRDTANTIEKTLQAAFPSSFSHKRYEETEEYAKKLMSEYFYHKKDQSDFEVAQDRVNRDLLPKTLLAARPPKTELPRYSAQWGDVTFAFTLDFGSFRDVQRHRAVTQRMPLLTAELGFENWYLDELPPVIRKQAETLLKEQEQAVAKIVVSPKERQYYYAMGYKLSNLLSGSLGALVYLAELRSTRFVHPTLRRRAIQMAEYLKKEFAPYGLVLHLDQESDRFDVKRGTHDIELKK